MQAIVTKYLCPTNVRGSRYKATCQAGSITVSADDGLNPEQNHKAVCDALCAKMDDANDLRYGIDNRRTWSQPKASGALHDGTWAHVFTEAPDVAAIVWSALPVSARETLAREAKAEFPKMAAGNDNWTCERISVTQWALLTGTIRYAITVQLS